MDCNSCQLDVSFEQRVAINTCGQDVISLQSICMAAEETINSSKMQLGVPCCSKKPLKSKKRSKKPKVNQKKGVKLQTKSKE